MLLKGRCGNLIFDGQHFLPRLSMLSPPLLDGMNIANLTRGGVGLYY